MKRSIFSLVVLMVSLFTMYSSAENSVLDLVAKEINKTCPQSIDEYTTMLRVENTTTDFVYYYSFDNDLFVVYEEVPSALGELKKVLLNEVRNLYIEGDTFMKYFYELLVDNNKGIKWTYFDEEATKSFSVRINPAELKAILYNN